MKQLQILTPEHIELWCQWFAKNLGKRRIDHAFDFAAESGLIPIQSSNARATGKPRFGQTDAQQQLSPASKVTQHAHESVGAMCQPFPRRDAVSPAARWSRRDGHKPLPLALHTNRVNLFATSQPIRPALLKSVGKFVQDNAAHGMLNKLGILGPSANIGHDGPIINHDAWSTPPPVSPDGPL